MKKLQSVLVFILLLIGTNQSFAQKVYQWRGDDRDGIYLENKLMKVWPENGPALLWSNEEIGQGYAAPGCNK